MWKGRTQSLRLLDREETKEENEGNDNTDDGDEFLVGTFVFEETKINHASTYSYVETIGDIGSQCHDPSPQHLT